MSAVEWLCLGLSALSLWIGMDARRDAALARRDAEAWHRLYREESEAHDKLFVKVINDGLNAARDVK